MAAIWDEFEHDPRRAENSALRAGDRERDVIRRALGDAYADGRLDREEFDTRIDQVSTARTLGDLPDLVKDLVPVTATSTTAATRRDQAVNAYAKDRKDALWTFLSVSLLCWVIWVATSFGDGGFDPYFPWPLFPMLGTGINVGRMVFMRNEIIAQEVRSLEKKERKALERDARGELRPPE
ncbi:DUF1707 domain-containing protein [Nocardioides sp. JQ2195]|uniref:DUF1707 SHOCT-like domain-containing protein n=1 Tax=Nocardioides sp. JQ2195 TaxID=2592334 RepID=UPI00143E83BD|nr:DUF1707 domain-containing protein [Nocardioides sp. JQ2195]QIX26617.1 DUF1707 domain-containing protein [Nocardioides sp. JQ2195]